MCGITGFIDTRVKADVALPLLQKMTRALAHRGPDSEGYWQSPDGAVNLGHRRLAIIDLSPTGHQPMGSTEGVISYNGEIYNFPELKEDLLRAGADFRGTSDTEVLLRALATWGVEKTLERLNGMFAFAYWRHSDRKLILARDRFGEKPLYYSWQGGRFFFASELKALAEHPGFEREIDRDALAAYVRFNYVPWPHCIFKGVVKLPPGHYVETGLSGVPPASRPYWQLRDMMERRTLDLRNPDDPAVVDDLDRILSKAVGQRMLADVPLGAFLSGGIDSSTVVALMQKQSSRPIKTFNIGFAEKDFDESKHAAAVARHLGTEHYEHRIDSQSCLDVVARLADIYDEPFADSSQIPTTLVSLFTRRHVTVALSGDAGDELFAGYNRYIWAQKYWPLVNAFPRGIRSTIGRSLQGVNPATWDRAVGAANHLLPQRLRVRAAGDKLHKLGSSLSASDLAGLYRGFVSQWQHPSRLIRGASEATTPLDSPGATPAGLNDVEKMMALDLLTYLPSDILTKVDRASMSEGLEARVPFLDNNVVQFAWSLPISIKLHRGVGKWPLRQVLKRYVPAGLFERPKTGFAIPLGEWLRGPLRGWAEDLLEEKALSRDGFFEPAIVRAEWAQHLAGRRNLQHTLWSVLMFQLWRRRWLLTR